MRGYTDTFLVIAQIAFRNLFASRLKTLIVGGIILFGGFLVVLGTSLLDSVDQSMKKSIVGSVAGDLQVYGSDSKEELDVMGGFNIEGSDVAPIERFEDVKKVLTSVQNVKTVVPMGLSGAFVAGGNTIDLVLADLRETVKERQASGPNPKLDARYEAQKSHVRQIVSVLKGSVSNARELADERALSEADLAELDRTVSLEFWKEFDENPLDALEFLENRVAPLATDADLLALRYVGTDPQAFARAFDRFQMVDGEMIPRGKAGFLFSKYVYENEIKMKAARSLDKIKAARETRGAKIAEDDELKRLVRENSTQVKELLLQLDEQRAALFRDKLKKHLGSNETDVGKLLSEFLNTDDDSFDARYAFFYAELAPHLALYRIPVGSNITIKAFTKSGYVQSVNLHVYGTFAFKGLENSPQAGSLNLMDLVSFRNLYGYLTKERAAEIAAMQSELGLKAIDRQNAEAELFGAAPPSEAPPSDGAPSDVPTGDSRPSDATAQADAAPASETQSALDIALGSLSGRRAQSNAQASYDPKNLEEGIVLNAAVLLNDPARIDETRAAIERAVESARLPLKTITWQQASGLTGQFVTLMRLVLYVAVIIIFVVALVIISNALVMATLERVREIGTLRALGAQRRFVLAMLVVESVLVGLVFGLLGAGLGAALVLFFGKTGLPAQNDVMTFFFSGSHLHPALESKNVFIALAIVSLVSVLSCFYPAWIAMRVTPRQAMSTEE